MYKSNVKSSCLIKMTCLYLLQTYTILVYNEGLQFPANS